VPAGEPYLRMFTRLHDTAGEPLWPGFRRTATTDWLAPLEDGLRSLVLAFVRANSGCGVVKLTRTLH
jgi:hypothetical protein